MPRGDRTGPEGLGPETGRAAGYCSGCTMPGFMNPVGGGFDGVRRGISGRAGRGRGNRNWYYATGLPGWERYNMGLPAWGERLAPPRRYSLRGHHDPYSSGQPPAFPGAGLCA